MSKHGVADHGPPIITEQDMQLLLCVTKWVETARKFGGEHYKDFIPHHADYAKSRLFWRIRSGKEPLPYPPPCAFSCPWYELIEEPEREHHGFYFWTKDGNAYICQTRYPIESGDIGELIVKFGPWRFKVRRDNERPDWPSCWIQRIEDTAR
jgi:hypothetical protein